MVANAYGLSDEELRRAAPALYAPQAYTGVSKRFTFLSTNLPLAAMRDMGYVPTVAFQGYSRLEGKAKYVRHCVRLRHRNDLGEGSAHVTELVLCNSHVGDKSFTLDLGVWRLVCSNGLIRQVPTTLLRFPHRGDIAERVAAATVQLLESIPRMHEEVRRMQATHLTLSEQLHLAEFGLRVRFDLEQDTTWKVVKGKSLLYEPARLLVMRRPEDAPDDLWTILNRVQEHLLKGGFDVAESTGQVHRTRRLTDIEKMVTVNKRLWQEAVSMIGVGV